MDGPLVITGMHRSGTSLAASAAQRAGIDLGAELLAPNPGNPRGYFEDSTVVRLHDDLFRRRGLGPFVRRAADLGKPLTDDATAVRRWIDGRPKNAPWGFKDPRAALFLDLWDDSFRQAGCGVARYLFLYRPPIDVVLSLRRRAADPDVLADVGAVFDAWRTVNTLVVDFYRRCAERCLLVDARRFVDDPGAFADSLGKKLGLCWDENVLRQLTAPDELHRTALRPAQSALLQRLDSETCDVYSTLARLADLPADDEPEDGEPAPDERLHHLARAADAWSSQEDAVGPLLELFVRTLEPAGAAARHLAELGRKVRSRDERIHELEANLLALQSEFAERSRWTLELRDQLQEREEQLRYLQEAFDERTAWALEMRDALEGRSR